MTTTTLLLQLGETSLDLTDWDDTGVVVASFDPGYPAPKEVVTDLPGQDGDYDETAYVGARVVTITGNFIPNSGGLRPIAGRALLKPFLNPAARPQIVYTGEDGINRMITLRASDFTAPTTGQEVIPFTASWTTPDPIAYALTENQVQTAPSSSGAGRTYPRAYPRSYPAGWGDSGILLVSTAGDWPTWPVLRIFGGCTDPAVYWVDATTGAELGPAVVFTGLTINDGHYIEVDTKAQTVILDGDPTASRYSYIDFGNTTWGRLIPGDNSLRFDAASASSPAVLQVLWTDAYLI